MLSSRCITICSTILVALLPFTALAVDNSKAKAKKHFSNATRLYENENYEGAVTEFETSIQLYPTKNAYFNLANCYNALHRYEEALTALKILERRFADKLDATMRSKAERLKSLILSLVGQLTIVVTPLEAEVFINNKRLPPQQVGKPLHLGPGEYHVEAQLDGYSPAVETITLHSQQKQTVDLTVSPLGGRLVIETDVAGATVVVDGEAQGEAPVTVTVSAGEHEVEIYVGDDVAEAQTVEAESAQDTLVSFNLAALPNEGESSKKISRKSLFRTLKIVGIASTAATFVASGVFYGFSFKYAADFDDYNKTYASEPSESAAEQFYTKAQDAKKSNKMFSNMGLAFGISAGVLAASTVALFVLDRRLNNSNESSRVSFQGGALKVSF